MDSDLPPDMVKSFVIAGHGNLAKVTEMLATEPRLLNAAYSWSESDHETAIQGAAQVGSASVAEFLLERGAPLDICTAAMLGRSKDVERFIGENPGRVHAKGAHGIPLLPHAALSGNVDLVKMLWDSGSTEGASLALQNAVSRGRIDVARWLLENAKPDRNAKNYQGKTVLAVAIERKDSPMESLLREHGFET
jgi:uncharacterized protein